MNTPKMDKSKLIVTDLKDSSEERKYWHTRSPQERLANLELNRQIIYGYDPFTTRLHRVFEITQRS